MKEKIFSYLFVFFLIVVAILNIVYPDKEISITERRKLKQFPTLNINTILNGDFFDNLEDYNLDQMLFRDDLKKINSFWNENIFFMFDQNNLVIDNDFIFKISYKINEKNVLSFSKKINRIINDFSNSNIYFAMIPDKNYYMNEKYLKMNYIAFQNLLKNNINTEFIDLLDSLDLTNYYLTDIHIKQDGWNKVINRLEEKYNFKINTSLNKVEVPNFYGSLSNQLGIFKKSDTLNYYTSIYTDSAVVTHLEYPNIKTVYDLSKLDGVDYYDIYLSGASSYIEIKNSKANNDKELIIFRDSFTSSLTPLLLEAYKKITLVDLRYIDYDIVKDYLKFENKDVLFLYSADLINNSGSIKVKI